MKKHTPGPWRIVTSWYDYMVEGPNGEEIIWQDGAYDTPTISKADAYLMAAAPDLLEALRSITDAADEKRVTEKHYEIARAAIAKATGEKE
jgi:hypothetical protein